MDDLERELARRDQFLEILGKKQIRTVFQPIVSLRDGSVFGYEALSRGPLGSELHSPGALFACAERWGKLWELESLCRVMAIESAHRLRIQPEARQTDFRLFLNVNPQVIHDPEFQKGFTREHLSQYGLNSENVIFEITEKGAVDNISDFIRVINSYKNQNYRIAIDDAGAGYSGLNMISDIHPHFIILDMNLIRGIDQDVTKQTLIRCLADFASLTNTHLIAEGIETEKELVKLIEIGVHFGQGFFLQKPEPRFLAPDRDVVHIISENNRKKNHLSEKRSSDIFISNISTNQKSTHPKILVSRIFDLMQHDLSIPGICVTEDECVTGILTRSDLYRQLSGQYGYNLYARKPVEAIMNRQFLQVDYHESIETVAKKAMGRAFENLYDFITVTQDGKYFGIVTVKDLLEKSFQVEINNAKHINPLSELPGNVLIEQRLETCIHSDEEYKILYFDMNNFKAYNDVYGFENGDRFLKHFSGILREVIPQDRNFIGHIGGDDFVAILSDDDAEEYCRRVIRSFDHSVPLFYNENDLQRGYITTKNRHDIDEDFPLLSISVVAVSSRRHSTIYGLSKELTRLKKTCKQSVGSNYIIGY
jgi:EAL domain-containing protein (putative c-di-GMP-specific phosphodiesterase class I)/GGDEF domain-containing protein